MIMRLSIVALFGLFFYSLTANAGIPCATCGLLGVFGEAAQERALQNLQDWRFQLLVVAYLCLGLGLRVWFRWRDSKKEKK